MTRKDAIYCIVILILAVWLVFKPGDKSEAIEKEKAAQANVDRLNAQLDSLTERVRITDEALEKADAIILGYKSEVVKAHTETQKWRTKYETTDFKRFDNDSLRIRELSKYFPSLNNR